MRKKLIFVMLFLIFACIIIYFVVMQKNTVNNNNLAKDNTTAKTSEEVKLNSNTTNNKVEINETSKNEINNIKQKNYQIIEENEINSNSNIEIELKDVEGKQTTYIFTYKNEVYTAIFKNGCWKIINSYKIKDTNDMKVICQALLDKHKVYGKDRKSYRTAGDMVYEWVQHNLAYSILSEDSEYKERAKDVDLDPDDQGKNFIELYEDKTGKKINFSDIINSN